MMNIERIILKIAESQPTFTVNDILTSIEGKYTRAYILRFIKNLIDEGEIVKSGSTRGAVYASREHADNLKKSSTRRYRNDNLKEHEILEDFFITSPLLRNVPENVKSIFEYAFTEMVNNAIEHSQSKYIEITVEREKHHLLFTVHDFGIGVFRNVMKKRNLDSEVDAIRDILKGKVTTQPHAHSGEGIFFTSKSADVFTLRSFGHELRVDNLLPDVFINEFNTRQRGTEVIFQIKLTTPRHLNEVFEKYYSDPEQLAFDKTEVQIRLYTMGSIYISRSQARRVLSGLDKFRSIILDFDRVPGIGQAFADEVFRVFVLKHPHITITPIHMNESVRFMVNRVEKP